MHIQKTKEDTFGDMLDELDEDDMDEQVTKAEIFEYGAGTHMRLPTEGKAVEVLTEPLLEKSKEELIAENTRLKARLDAAEKENTSLKSAIEEYISDSDNIAVLLDDVLVDLDKLKPKKATT